jgi:hypothetical protein
MMKQICDPSAYRNLKLSPQRRRVGHKFFRARRAARRFKQCDPFGRQHALLPRGDSLDCRRNILPSCRRHAAAEVFHVANTGKAMRASEFTFAVCPDDPLQDAFLRTSHLPQRLLKSPRSRSARDHPGCI